MQGDFTLYELSIGWPEVVLNIAELSQALAEPMQGDFTLPELSTGLLDSGWTSDRMNWLQLCCLLVTLLLEYLDECTITMTVLLEYLNRAFLWVVAFLFKTHQL